MEAERGVGNAMGVLPDRVGVLPGRKDTVCGETMRILVALETCDVVTRATAFWLQKLFLER